MKVWIVPYVWPPYLRTPLHIALYPLSVGADSFLSSPRKTREYATLGIMVFEENILSL